MSMSFTPIDWVKLFFERKDMKRKEREEDKKELLSKIDSLGSKMDDSSRKIDDFRTEVNQLSGRYDELLRKVEEMNGENCTTKKEILEELVLIKAGLQKELFDTLYVQCKRFCDQNFCSPNDKGSYEEIYNVYHGMGRNGRADAYLKKVMALPDEKEEENVRSVN